MASTGDLRAALESLEGLDIKILDAVPAEDAEAEPKEESEEDSADGFSESDPVRRP